MTEQEIKHIESIVLDEIETGIPFDVASCNLGDFDWSYYDYNGTDVTIGQAVEDYNVYRTFGVGMQEVILVKEEDGTETHVNYREFDDFCNDHRDKCELMDNSEMSMDFECYGEWKQVWLNCKTGEMLTRIKIDKYGRVNSEVKEWTSREYATDDYRTYYHADLSIHPILERNGMEEFYADQSWYCDTAAKEDYAQRLILSRGFEIIVKLRGSAFAMDMTYEDDHIINEFASALRVAKRHHYKPTDQQMWDDMVLTMIRMSVDVHSPFYVCPEDLKRMHDIMNKRYAKVRKELEYKRALKEAEKDNSLFNRLRGAYLGIVFENDKYIAWPLQSKAEYVIEGKEMHHCVGTGNYWSKKDTICLTIRDKDGNRLTTCELNLHDGSIHQNYAACDKIHPEDKAIRLFVKDNFWRFEEARDKVAKLIPITQPVKQAA